MAAAEADPNIANYALPSMSTGYLAFQQCTEPFDDVKVRWAVAYAIDRQALIDAFYTEYDVVAQGFMPPLSSVAILICPTSHTTPKKAKALLAEAGLADGFSTELWYVPVIRGYFPDGKAIAEIWQLTSPRLALLLN